MSRPASASRPARTADQHPAGVPAPADLPGPAGLGDLGWTDVADIVWLAAAIRPAAPAPPPPPTGSGPAGPEPARPVGAAPAVPAVPAVPAGREDVEVPRPAAPPVPSVPVPVAATADPVPATGTARPGLRLVEGGNDVADVVTPVETLAFFRALRPLKQRISSRRPEDLVLDEVATAEQAAATGNWWPVLGRRKERGLSLTLVIDGSPSMRVWHARITQFVEILERLGAFRSIQVRLLDTDRSGGECRPVLRGATPGTAARDPAEILDPSGRRAVLLVTDGVDDTWRRRTVLDPVLSRWARSMPVTLVQLLPQWLWGRCGLDLRKARLSVRGGLKPNDRWAFELPDEWLADEPAPPDAIPVPVVELGPRWLGWWAKLITGAHRRPVEGTVVLVSDRPRPATAPAPTASSAAERVDHFRSTASPPASRLAALLAALPVDLDTAELVRRRFVPDAGPEHLSEILLSVMYAPALGDRKSTWDTGGAFEFPEAVRELLLNGARRTETANVVRVAAAHFGERIPVLGHLRDAIADPNNTPDPVLTRESTADVALEGAVMRALSGPYLSRADRLRNAVLREAPAPAAAPDTTVSATMHETAERADRPSDSASGAESRSVRHQTERPDPVTTPLAHPAAVSTRSFPPRQADDPPPVWGNVPPRNPNFTGRAELLEQLGKRLTAGGTTAVLPSALHGMGGIGKTQMATEYIYRHLQDYDLIWWIDAAHTTQIRAGLTELAKTLGLPGGTEATIAVPAVIEALRTGRPFRRWLLVFDAADSPEAVLPFFPRNGPGEILITSRNSDWAGIARPLELAVFTRAESIELLGRRGPEITHEDADALAEKLGDLPLAVEQAAAWRAVTGMPVREYLRLFDESVAEILDTATAPDYEVSVAAAWNVSFEELKTRNPAAHQILHICAFFSPEPISRDLLTGVRRVSISPELDAALQDPIKLARAIRDINRYGLAKIDHGNNTLQLHRLVQLVLRNRVMAPLVHKQMQHGAHQLLASLDPNDPESSRNWPRYRELLPHAYAANVVDCDEGWARQLVVNIMRFLFEWGDHEEAAQLGLRAREHFTRTLGPTHEQTLEVSSRLGLYLWAVGRYQEAAELNQRTLALRLQVSGEENEETFALQRNIVTDLRAQGSFAEGAKLSEEIYHKSKRMFGEDDPESLDAAFQHALSLRLSGEYRAAAKLDEETYRRRREVLGPDQPRTLSVRCALIIDRREAGEYGQARVMQEKVTERFRTRYPDHPHGNTYDFLLAVARRKDGEHNGALELSTRALERIQLTYGDNHTATVSCAQAHSIDLRHSGDLAAARKLGEQAFEQYRAVLGEYHPHTLAAAVNLAVTLRHRGEIAECRELDERSLEHFRAGIGPDHPYAIVATINLASDLAALGDHERAIALGRDAVERGNRVLGPDHPTALAAAFNLGLDLASAGRSEEVPAYRDPILAKYRVVLGEAHPGTQAAVRGARADCDIDPMMM